jgi:serine/threonine-protein kinase
VQAQRAQEKTEDELREGDVIAGRFEIVRTLGRGGMATVYEARHQVTQRPVALKVASQKLLNNQLLSGRFLREAQTASTIRHAHAIEVSDVFEAEDGRPVMVMELLTGRDLAAWISDGKKLSPAEVAEIFVPVLSALAHAHAEGIVHRDMKPDNIFLTEKDGKISPKVLDFGIAKVVGEAVDADLKLTSTGMLLGTPFYMSPEQVSGREDLDHLADIWSVGVCMYEALNGELPFQGANFGQVFAAILQADPPKMKANVPPELEDLVRRCLSKKPEDRPQDCGELAEALRVYGGTDSGGYPAPASSSGRFAVVRADELPKESAAPTLMEEDDDASKAFDDTTLNVRPVAARSRTPLIVAALVVAAAIVVAALLARDTEETTPPVTPEPEIVTSDPTPPSTSSTAEIEEAEPVAEEQLQQEEDESASAAALEVEPAPRMSMRPSRMVRMTRMTAMQTAHTAETAGDSTMSATMSGIIDEL